MTTETHRIFGLSAPKSFTLRNQFGSWWAKSGLTDEKYNELFKWINGDDNFWKDYQLICTVEFENKSEDGTPINGTVINVLVKDKLVK